MKRLRSWCCRVLVGFLAWGVIGCGGEGKPIKVKGTVTLDGQPLPNGMVTFIPVEKDGRHATGMTGADGSFQLTTLSADDGAFPGQYKVAVQYHEPAPEVHSTPSPEGKGMKASWDAAQRGMKEQRKKPPKYVIPAKYSDPGQTILTQKVPPDGPVNLELQSK
jgi:hypothetical protein